MGIIPCITKPTRISKTSATLIDQMYINNKLFNNMTSEIILSDTSDHLPCLIILGVSTKKVLTTHTITGRCVTDHTVNQLIQYLNLFDWSNLNMYDTEQSFDMFMNVLNTGMDNYMPEVTKTLPSKKIIREPWVTKGIVNCVRKCKRLYSKSLNTNMIQDRTKYVEYRNVLNKAKRNAKCMYYNNFFVENYGNVKKSWKMLNKLIGRSNDKSCIPDCILHNGNKISDVNEMSENYNLFFGTIGKCYAEKIPKAVKSFKDYLGTKCPTEIEFKETTPLTIAKIIKSLPNKKSSGHDEINNVLVKRICNGICAPLSMIVNKSMSEGKVPDTLKKAIVIPLYKGGDKKFITNYRPISLLPVFSKVLEKVIYEQVYDHMMVTEQLSEFQFGFREKHSCEDCILYLLSKLCRSEKQHTMSLFLDTSKAFDSIPQKILLEKLDHYGIRNMGLKWFRDYFKNRTQHVKINKVVSSEINLEYGIGQGSILGPLVFLITINDIFKVCKYSNLIGFADDVTMFHQYHNAVTLGARIKSDLRRLIDWFRSNKLTLNLDKSSLMVFSNTKFNGFNQISIDNVVIKRVSKCKLLGVIIDENLKWHQHVENLNMKMSSGRYAINSTKNYLPSFIKLRIYHSFVSSHLQYCIKVWGPMLTNGMVNKLQTAQNNCIRSICNLKYNESVTGKHLSLKLLNIRNLIQLNVAKFMYKYEHDLLPISLRGILSGNPVHDYDTRQKDSEYYYKNCIFSQGKKVWENIPTNIRLCPSISSFTRNLKYHLLSNQ